MAVLDRFRPAKTEDHPALDALAGVLRGLAEASAPAEHGEPAPLQVAEAWARHVLVGAPHPKSGAEGGKRDFHGARSFAVSLLERQTGRLREAVATLVRGLDTAVKDASGEDARVEGQLERLRAALDSGDPERLRAAASGAVEVISAAVVERRERNQQRLSELGTRVRALAHELAEARREGATDALTRLPNRKAFDEAFQETWKLGGPAVLLLADIDRFKQVNDAFGHPAGDVLLKRVADRLAACFLRRTDLVARYGGEEFAVLLRDMPASEARALAARALAAVRTAPLDDVCPGVKVTISIGFAALERGDSPGAWLDRADQALYAAKSDGRDRVVEQSR